MSALSDKHNLIAEALSRFPVSPKESMDSTDMEVGGR